jgi:hypothetical protein
MLAKHLFLAIVLPHKEQIKLNSSTEIARPLALL